MKNDSRRTSQLSLTKVNFDIESQDFDEEKVIKETLRSAIRNGRVGSFFVESEGFTFRPVTGKSVFFFSFLHETLFNRPIFLFLADLLGPSISPIDPEDPELTEDCDVPCQSGGECVRLDQRCDGTEDCRDGSDEYGCRKSLSFLFSSRFIFLRGFRCRDQQKKTRHVYNNGGRWNGSFLLLFGRVISLHHPFIVLLPFQHFFWGFFFYIYFLICLFFGGWFDCNHLEFHHSTKSMVCRRDRKQHVRMKMERGIKG